MYIYDSRDISCKSPFGAVKTDETVVFTIRLPKIRLNCDPVLKVFAIDHENDGPTVVRMRFWNSTLTENRYRCEFSCGYPALLVYCFELNENGRIIPVKRGNLGEAVMGDGSMWQLTVYDAAMKAPSFLREGVMYQIFPDRFASSGAPKQNVPSDRVMRSDWDGMPFWRPNEKGEVTNSDYFGGDLKGIEEKLDYLESLGVTCIYLNPIFEAHANHRYNTADYSKTDPLLGTNEDFENLARAAKNRGISIIIDGVFSHTGSDSVYFNKNRRYGSGGAYNDLQSPYREWYAFRRYPDQYDSWWGFPTLPNVDETTPSYLEFICGENGILRQWMDLGASGFRLDVADELPDGFIDALHDRVKTYNPDCAVIGEVWEDASNKVSYGLRRRYLLGGQLDSVMNYPFKDAILHYMRWGGGEAFLNLLMQILENYPKPAIQALMNSLSTHDTPRAITALAGFPMEQNGREWQEWHHRLSAEEYSRGVKLLSLSSILQFGLPGIPCVYYGDEAGLTGYRDPFNRCCYPWGEEDRTLVEFIASLGKLRRDYPVFADAEFIPITFSDEVCCFERRAVLESIVFAVNRTDSRQRLSLPEPLSLADALIVSGEYRPGELGPYSGVVLRIKYT